MRSAVAHVTKEVDRLSAENQSLKMSNEAMRNVRRRIIVAKARAKAVEDLEEIGIKLGNESWIAFFFKNQRTLQESFGVPDGLMKLLKFGKGQLHATVHEVGYLELAEAVTSMENGGDRIEFEEAYLYYFGFSADSVFANNE